MDPRVREAFTSSATEEWPTPDDLYRAINKKYNFTLDAAATKENSKCPKFFTKEDDALKQSWLLPKGEAVWLNPPYCLPENPCKAKCDKEKCKTRGHHTSVYIPGTGDWMEKARLTGAQDTTVVTLVPSRTDNMWFHASFPFATEVRFLKGRLKFGNATTGALFPSCIMVFEYKRQRNPVPPRVLCWDWRNEEWDQAMTADLSEQR